MLERPLRGDSVVSNFLCFGKAGVLNTSPPALGSTSPLASGLAFCDVCGDEGNWGGTVIRAENGVGSINGAGSSVGTAEVRDGS